MRERVLAQLARPNLVLNHPCLLNRTRSGDRSVPLCLVLKHRCLSNKTRWVGHAIRSILPHVWCSVTVACRTKRAGRSVCSAKRARRQDLVDV